MFYDTKDLYEIPMGSPLTGRQMPVGLVKLRRDVLPLRSLTAENFCPFATVDRVHDGALTEEYVESSGIGGSSEHRPLLVESGHVTTPTER